MAVLDTAPDGKATDNASLIAFAPARVAYGTSPLAKSPPRRTGNDALLLVELNDLRTSADGEIGGLWDCRHTRDLDPRCDDHRHNCDIGSRATPTQGRKHVRNVPAAQLRLRPQANVGVRAAISRTV